MFDWTDIRFFLALTRSGSALSAAEQLNTNQTTVSRRISRLEHALNLQLFEKSTRGYALTRNGEEFLGLAERMETVAKEIDSLAARMIREVSGTIRFSGLVVTMRMYGLPLMEMFRNEYPDVFFDVDTQDRIISLEKGEADIALRSADVIEGDTLIARKIDEQPWAMYCSNDYARQIGTPKSLSDCANQNILVYVDELCRSNSCIRWMHERLPKDRVVFRVDSPAGMSVALRTGAGVGLLPRIVGEGDPELTHCFGDPKLMHPIWIVASKESYATPLVRTFLDFFAQNLERVRQRVPD